MEVPAHIVSDRDINHVTREEIRKVSQVKTKIEVSAAVGFAVGVVLTLIFVGIF